MKKKFSFIVAGLALASIVLAAAPLSVEALLKDAKKLDKMTVTVTGVVAKFSAKTSKKGNKYTTFDLKGKGEKIMINVYLQGHLTKPVKNGDTVQVTGKWQVEKKMGDRVFKNEIDASTAKAGMPQNVKLIKAGAAAGSK